MSTCVFTKKEFIAYLQKGLDDNDIILQTKDLEGSLQVVPKRNVKKVTFAFAADAFAKKDGVGDIAFGKVTVVAFAICAKEDVSETTIGLLKKVKNVEIK